jgi:16S rRNA (guanine527-N7)-methyltransferase
VECSTGNILSGAPASAGELLDSGLEELGLAPPGPVRQALLALAALLSAWSQRINLTGHRSPEAIVGRLILDAVALGQVLPPASRLVDLGSGAGFPGLPLAVLRPSLPVLLVEARERRHHFQRAVVRELALANVSALRGRAEQLTPQPAPLVIAQAVAAPDTALALARPWVEAGGWVGIPGSDRSEGPETRSEWIVEVRGLVYRVPAGGPERRLWLGRAAGGVPAGAS